MNPIAWAEAARRVLETSAAYLQLAGSTGPHRAHP